ncbi:DUF411 domain-containing protein [Pseudovibrio sp. Tun.PSC04-5.I4]|uniref:DUF411 domain-containing protein n=1 Tax=Pseudovibrio sp. Tun.PSC04-5.I4 TaxID=1798213 RepID=UPI0008902CED|nr:DUF411 domain-containing protein [Pseudovibrio sp. Tun.PSC04-5.I4]SDR47514.1 Uncharacterized conserved protein [Pseudovibrio sp. Tun.PSC04-5.I4]
MISKRNLLASVFAVFLGAGTFSLPAYAEGDKDVTLYKSPNCGCCTAWGAELEKAGFNVTVKKADDLYRVKQQVGVPENMEACHTAIVDGYVLEGHVPLDAVNRMLSERPEIRGLSVPGMPMGSLGMGEPDENTSYTVFALSTVMGGEPVVYQTVGN